VVAARRVVISLLLRRSGGRERLPLWESHTRRRRQRQRDQKVEGPPPPKSFKQTRKSKSHPLHPALFFALRRRATPFLYLGSPSRLYHSGLSLFAMSAHRLTLAQQLKQLESDDPSSNPLFNPDNDDTALDGLSRPAEGIHREHYLDVGPSRLRNQMGGLGGLEGAEQTLRSEKYGGKVTGRMKIFDDDEDEEEGGDGVDEDDEEGEEEGDEEDEEEGDEEGEEDDDEDEDEDEEESDGDEEDEDEEDEEDEGDEDDEEEESAPPRARPGSSKALDPIAALKDSRLKDIEKGRGIRRQRVSQPVPLGSSLHAALCASTLPHGPLVSPLTTPNRACLKTSSPCESPSKKPLWRARSCPSPFPLIRRARSRRNAKTHCEVSRSSRTSCSH
jgi:hypothetical protein